MKGLTLHIQSEVGCSPPCLIVAHHLVHSTVTPGGVADGDGADRVGCPTTTGMIWPSLDQTFQHSGGSAWEEGVCWWV